MRAYVLGSEPEQLRREAVMSQRVTPVAELGCDEIGTPTLVLSNLDVTHLKAIHEALILNGLEPIHDARSKALAHLGKFDGHTGLATIHVHGENDEDNAKFVGMLSSRLGIQLPDIPSYATA